MMQIYKKNNENKGKNKPHNLDTLAQLRTAPIHAPSERANLTINHKAKLTKKARSKYFTSKISIRLAELRNDLEKYYRNAYYCAEIITQQENKFTAKYCNTRICNVCNRIRTAKLIHGYNNELDKLDGYFVTLTIPNVKETELRKSIEEMGVTFRRITNKYRNRRNVKLKGLRKLEITYNAIRNDYHPHYHLLVDGRAAAASFLKEWLGYYPEAVSVAQDMRKAEKGTYLELFKYVTKVVAKDVNGNGKIYIHAIDTIVKALRDKRTFQPFGGVKMISEDIEELQAEELQGVPEYDFMEWFWEEQDWINKYGECLTGYEASEELKKLLLMKC